MSLRTWKTLAVLAALTMPLLLPPRPALAAATTYAVNNTSDGYNAAYCTGAGSTCNLRTAIIKANANPGHDTINIAAGTYTLTIPPGGTDESFGDLDITDGVTLIGAGAGLTIIQAGTTAHSGIDRVLQITTDPAKDTFFTIQNLTIQNGYLNGTYDYHGGGVDFIAMGTVGSLTISGVTIKDNRAYYNGGGLLVENWGSGIAPTVQISGSTISGNIANGQGGGMVAGWNVPVNITGTTISGNRAGDPAATPGVDDFGEGAGIYLYVLDTGGPSAIANSTITDNHAYYDFENHNLGGDGGGIFTGRALTITDTIISNNSSDRNGGGLLGSLIGDDNLTLTNLSVSGNTAKGFGGGIAYTLTTAVPVGGGSNIGPIATMNGGTLTSNTAGSKGGGIYSQIHDNNTTVAGSVTMSGVSVTNNTATGDGGGIYHETYTTPALAMSNLTQTNMTLTGNHGANGGGLAISGDINYTLNGTANTFSNNVATGNGGGLTYNVTGTVGLSNLTANANQAVNGGGLYHATAATTTITNLQATNNSASGNGAGLSLAGSSAITLTQPTVTGNTATLDGGGIYATAGGSLTLTQAAINNNTGRHGGGAYYTAGTISQTNVTIQGNTATGNGGGLAIAGTASVTTRTANILTNNASGNGGGIYSSGGSNTIYATTIAGNSANTAGGGLVTAAGTHALTNVTVSGNTTQGTGGGLQNQGATVTATNVTVANNQATGGGGLYLQGGTTTIHNTIVGANLDRAATPAANDVKGTVNLVATSSYNLLGTGGAGGLTNGTNGNKIATTLAEVGLEPLANYGGPVNTHKLKSTSLALDGGDSTKIAETTDARGTGYTRKLDAGDSDAVRQVDIGAFEAHPAIAHIPTLRVLQDTVTTQDLTFNVGDTLLGVTTPVVSILSDPSGVLQGATLQSYNTSTGTGTVRVALNAGAYGTATVKVRVDAPTYNGGQFMEDTFTVDVVPPPVLEIARESYDTLRQGDTGKQYTFRITNTGPGDSLIPGDPLWSSARPKVTVTDTFPAGLTPKGIVNSTDWTCDPFTGQTATCYYNAVIAKNGGSTLLTLSLDVAWDAGTPLANTASVVGGGDQTPAGTTDSVAVTQTPDLVVAASHVGAFRQGESGQSLILTVTNNGPGATDQLPYTVTDTLPAGLTYTGCSGTGWTCTYNAGTSLVTATGTTSLAPGESSALTVSVDVARDAATGGSHQLTNTAHVAGGGELAQRSSDNASLPDTITVTQMPDLTVAVAVPPGTTFRQGQPASYTITVTNSGFAATAFNYTVTDSLPAGLSYTGSNSLGWLCSASGQDVTCTNNDPIAPNGGTASVTINVDVAGTAGTPVLNTAHVAYGPELYTSNNDAPTISTPVAKAPDLAVTKTHSGTWTQGDTGKTYTITVSNSATAGPTFETITLTDTLPTGLSYTGYTAPGWTCGNAGQTVTCTSTAAIAAGAYATITLAVDVAANATTPLVNQVSVSGGGELSTTLTDNSNTDATDIVQLPDLTVTAANNGPFAQGQTTGATLTYTVSNQGQGTTAGQITLTDTLPAGLTYVGATGWTCSAVGQAVTCTANPPLASGATATVTLSVSVARDAAASLSHQAHVAGGGEQGGQSANNASAPDPITVTQMPDLTVAVAVPPGTTFRQGQPASYALTVTNSGFATTDGSAITVTDTLPAGVAYSGFSGAGWTCSNAGQDVTCSTSAAIAAGASDTVTVDVNVAGTATSPVSNTAHVAYGPELYTSNNDAPTIATTVAQAPDLTVALTAVGTFEQSNQGAYTITVTNAGAGATWDPITVSGTLSAQTSFVSAGDGTTWVCTETAGTFTCTRTAALASGARSDITLTVAVAATAPTSITNAVAVSGGGELNAANNSATQTSHVTQHPDLAVSMTHADPFVQGQSGATYTITVKNIGTGETEGTITVNSHVPADLTAQGATSTDFSCATIGNDLTCTRTAALVAGPTEYTITLAVDVPKTAPATVTNTATVSVTGDVNGGNDTASDPTQITQKPDLRLTVSHAGDFRQGQTGADYLIRVHNGGAADTAGTVTVTDSLPAGLSYTGFTGTGWSCTAAGQLVTCTSSAVSAPGQDFADLTLTVDVSATAAALLTNTASVAGGGEIIDTNNDATDATTVTQVANLVVEIAHTATFTQGDAGKTFAITVRNTGTGPTDAPVTLAVTLPSGLINPVLDGGTAFICAGLTCTTAAVLPAGQAYAPLTLTVDVAATAPPTQTVSVRVDGGGEAIATDNTAADAVSVVQLADLRITKAHSVTFHIGHKDLPYYLTVTNAGQGPTSGTVTVTDTLPAELTAKSMTGTGWTCVLATLTCTRSDALASLANYPPITLLVDVATNSARNVTNTATVAGGGEVITNNNTADDPTEIRPVPPPPPPTYTLTISAPVTLTREASITVSGIANPGSTVQVGGTSATADNQGRWSASVALVEGPNVITATSGTATASVTVTRDSTPPPLTLTASATTTTEETVVLTATSEAGARIKIEGRDGATLQVRLKKGANLFTATATDLAGNTATASVTVTRTEPEGDKKSAPVEPEQPTDLLHRNWTVHLPAQTVTTPITVTLQVPGANEATRRAAAVATLVSATEINAVTAASGSEVHQLARKVTITFTYDPAQVPDPSRLRIFYYDPTTRAWEALPTVVDPVNHTVCGETDHFSLYAALLVPQQVPALDALPATAPQRTLTVTGRGEPGTQVTLLLNGAAGPQAQVGADGSFRVAVPLRAGQNRLRAVSADGVLASSEAQVTYLPTTFLTDVAGHWAEVTIAEMVEAGVVKGYEDRTFRPENRVTRAEFAVMLGRLLKLPESNLPMPFTDASSIPDWARRDVAAMAAAGIAITQPDGSFGPSVAATRTEMAAMLTRALQYRGMVSAAAHKQFTDADQIPAWAVELISAATEYGLIQGYPDGSFKPGNPATRAEAVTMFSRLRRVLGQ